MYNNYVKDVFNFITLYIIPFTHLTQNCLISETEHEVEVLLSISLQRVRVPYLFLFFHSNDGTICHLFLLGLH